MQSRHASGGILKNTPSRDFCGGNGISLGLDIAQDKVKAIEDQNAGENGGPL